MSDTISSLRSLAQNIGLKSKNFLSVNDISNDQLYQLFHLAKELEPYNKKKINLLEDQVLCVLFYQPSTRTRLSFETAMYRLGGAVLTESSPLLTSAAAKEESLNDTVTVISRYPNCLVLRHGNSNDALDSVKHASCPVINAGFGHWEHPTQALVDSYTIWRTLGKVQGVRLLVTSADLVHARTAHSTALLFHRLGAEVSFTSTTRYAPPKELLQEFPSSVSVLLDPTPQQFQDAVRNVDVVYLPGCSAPAGQEAEEFKKLMAPFFIPAELMTSLWAEGKKVYVTHALPRRPGEMDEQLDHTPAQLYFEAIGHSVSIRMALLAALLC